MTKQEWMRNEIAGWRSEGVIGGELAETLLMRYPENESRRGRGALLAGMFGALLTGLGIIAIFAANWDSLNRGERAAAAIAPAVICGAIAIWAGMKRVKTMLTWEPLGILWSVSTGAGACLVAQTYQLGGSVPGLILLVALLTLPVVWITRSAAATAFWPAFAVYWAYASEEASGESWLLLVKSLGLAALSVPAYAAFLRGKPGRASLTAVQVVTGLIYTTGMASMTLLAAPVRFWDVPEGIVGVFWAYSAVVFILGLRLRLGCWPTIAAINICGAAAATPFVNAGLYVVSVAGAAAAAWHGIARLRLSWMNTGTGLLLWLVLGKFFECDASFTVKGVVLICLGVALSALNGVIIRKKKRRDGE